MKPLKPALYLPAEEIANSITHGIGVLAAITGLVLLTIRSRGFLGGRELSAMGTTSYVLFTATMICMFLTSTLYHMVRRENLKRVFRILDHSAIYLLIAGTYTPFCLTALRGPWGWTLFGLEWSMAILGITFHALNNRTLKKIELAIYIIMGWAMAAGWAPLMNAVSTQTLVLLLAGGISYTLGVYWFKKKNMPGSHAIWHMFVLAGAVCHWGAVWVMG